MNIYSIVMIVVSVVLGSLGGSTNAWAGGSGNGNTTCLIDTSSSLGPSITGTAAIHGIPLGASSYNLDVILRLQWQGQENIFRVFVPGAVVASPQGTGCDILAATPINGAGQTIQVAFGLVGKTLKLNNRSITGIDWIHPVPGSGNNITFADVTIYPQ